MKKVISVLWILVMAALLVACGNSTSKENQKTQLGSSKLSIVLPEGYAAAEDDFDEDQVAYYHKDNQSIDFDVYQWEKGSEYNLEEEAAYFSAQYGTTAAEANINGVPGMKYISAEEYDGHEYTVINYMFDDGENIVELCFWTVNTAEEIAAVDQIVNTISVNET